MSPLGQHRSPASVTPNARCEPGHRTQSMDAAPRDSRADILARIRRAELEAALTHIPPRSTLLEIGGGSGWQASLLQHAGHLVVSVDLPTSRNRPRYFPVINYDGRRLPFRTGSFSAVFSSNVLEHVENLDTLLLELDRVLAPGGVCVHMVPTATWRIWTSLLHYPDMAHRAATRLFRGLRRHDEASERQPLVDSSFRLGHVLVEQPHGISPSIFHEIWRFGRWSWVRTLTRPGYSAPKRFATHLFYTGQLLVPTLSVAARERLGRMLGSSCVGFVLRKGGNCAREK